MKTKELIRRLQEEDPLGETEVNVNGEDIYFCEKYPGYYDGAYEVLIHAEHRKPYYSPIGAKICRRGEKVVIKTLSSEDLLWDNPDALIQYDAPETEERYKCGIERKREEIRGEIARINTEIDAEQQNAFEKDYALIMEARNDRLYNAADFLQRVMTKTTRSEISQLLTPSGEPVIGETPAMPENKEAWGKISQVYKLLEEIKNETKKEDK